MGKGNLRVTLHTLHHKICISSTHNTYAPNTKNAYLSQKLPRYKNGVVVFGKVGIWCLHKGLWLIAYPNNIHLSTHMQHIAMTTNFIFYPKNSQGQKGVVIAWKTKYLRVLQIVSFDFRPRKTYKFRVLTCHTLPK